MISYSENRKSERAERKNFFRRRFTPFQTTLPERHNGTETSRKINGNKPTHIWLLDL